MTEEQMRELISNQKTEIQQKDEKIEALESKSTTDTEKIKNLEEQVKELKIKNHDLFLKVVQEPISNNNDNKDNNVVVESLSDITNKLINQ